MSKLVNLEPFSLELSKYGVISVKGEDATSFLNSQTTNNIKLLKDQCFQYDALLDIAGKIETYFITLKISNSSYKLLTPLELLDESFNRIQKFHITEDVEFSFDSNKYFVNFFSRTKDSFVGKLGSFEASISTNTPLNELEDDYESSFALVGAPIYKKTIQVNELINNTLLANLAIDYNKGCFLGQETVSKVNSRRGAAKAPIFLESPIKLNLELPHKLKSYDQKIGEAVYELCFKEKYYYLCFLNRENQVDNKEIFIGIDNKVKVTSKKLPLISIDDLSDDLYQSAVVDFQNSLEAEAIIKLKNIINANPSFDDAYESLGVIYGRQEKFTEAVDIMHELESNNPKSVMAQTNLSMFYMKLGEIEKAEAHKSNATINQFSAFGDIADQKRAKEEKEKQLAADLKRREEMFEQVLKIDPQDPLATFGLGELRLNQKKYQEAFDLLTNTIKSDSKYSVAYVALAKTLLALDQKDNAKDILKKGIEVSSKNGDLMPANEMQALLVSL